MHRGALLFSAFCVASSSERRMLLSSVVLHSALAPSFPLYAPELTVKHNMSRLLQLAVSFAFALRSTRSASPTSSCYGTSTTLDWYINAVGETPCESSRVHRMGNLIRNRRHDVPKTATSMQP